MKKRSSCVCNAVCLYTTAKDSDNTAYLGSILSSLDIFNCKTGNYSFWTYAGPLEGRLQDEQKVLKWSVLYHEIEEEKKGEWHWTMVRWIWDTKMCISEEQASDARQFWRVGHAQHLHDHWYSLKTCNSWRIYHTPCSGWHCREPSSRVPSCAMGRAGRLRGCQSLQMPTPVAGTPRREKRQKQ